MPYNKANRGNPRSKCVTVVLSTEEWQKVALYGKQYGLTPAGGARRLINEGLAFHQ